MFSNVAQSKKKIVSQAHWCEATETAAGMEVKIFCLTNLGTLVFKIFRLRATTVTILSLKLKFYCVMVVTTSFLSVTKNKTYCSF